VTAGRISVLIAGVIIGVVSYAFWPEIGGIMWHLRHGSAVQVGELRVSVPTFYSASNHPDEKLVYLIGNPGRARRYFKGNSELKFARISFRQSTESKPHLIAIETNDTWASHAYSKTLDTALKLAGDDGRCVQFNGPPLWDREKDVEIDCEFEGHYQAHFSGTQLGAEEFFSILKSVQHFKGSD
jgi:hypothetical protein